MSRPDDALGARPDVGASSPRPGSAYAFIELRGDLDLSTAEVLRQRLDETPAAQDVIVNVSAVPFIDSVALGMLARAAVRLGEHDRRLVLVGAGTVVGKVLAITRLGTLLPDVETIEEAEALLLSAPPASHARAPEAQP